MNLPTRFDRWLETNQEYVVLAGVALGYAITISGIFLKFLV